jgi:hypothetical protein
MPLPVSWRISAWSPGRVIGAAFVLIATLGGLNLWLQINIKSRSQVPPIKSALARSPHLFGEADFEYIQKWCNRGRLIMSNVSGEWYSAWGCTLPARGRRSVALPLDEILYDKTNKVIGFRRMLVAEKAEFSSAGIF